MISFLSKLLNPGRYIDYLDRVQGDIVQRIGAMSQELEDLRAAVAANAVVTESAVALIEGLADRLDAAIEADEDGDDEALTGLAADLRSQSRALADAVAANTQAGGLNPNSGAAGPANPPEDPSPVKQG